jgi:hypothetical protein
MKSQIEMSVNTANALGQMLDRYRWRYFFTLTTKHELTLKSARRLTEKTFGNLNARKQMQGGGDKSAVVWFVEAHKEKPGYHIHGLYMGEASKAEIHKTWNKFNGAEKKPEHYVRCLDYIKDYGASFYVAKYVVKGFTDWDFSLYGTNNLDDLICQVYDSATYKPMAKVKREKRPKRIDTVIQKLSPSPLSHLAILNESDLK